MMNLKKISRPVGFFLVIFSIVYLLSDWIEYFLDRENEILDFVSLPWQGRLLIQFYALVMFFAGFSLVKKIKSGWGLLVFASMGIILNLLFELFIYNYEIIFAVNWLIDFFILYLVAVICIILSVYATKNLQLVFKKNWLVLGIVVIINVVLITGFNELIFIRFCLN